jgi:phosphohistidine swiveling domain-containing protein
MREYSTRAYHLVRRYVLEAGVRLHRLGHLRAADDVFMLHASEFPALHDAGGQARLQAVVRFRRLMYRGYRLVEPPGELGRDVTHRAPTSGDPHSPAEVLLQGTGCSAGITRARVRVIHALEEADRLEPQEILVTRFTDPGWTPVLGLVSGIVTEVGGLLSHAAVIGREYGIPAVLNVRGATEILRTGQRVEIDGTAGTVRVLRDQEKDAPIGSPDEKRDQKVWT